MVAVMLNRQQMGPHANTQASNPLKLGSAHDIILTSWTASQIDLGLSI